MRRLLCLAGLLIVAAPVSATPVDLYVASVTCIPNTFSAQSCWTDPVATTAHWRVVNWLGAAASSGGWFNEDTGLFDVNLTFDYAGGSKSWHWDVVQPLRAFVETEELDIALFRSFEGLTLTGIVGRTEFPNWGGSPYQLLVLDNTRVSTSASQFPPPLDLVAQAERVDLPVPEPTSLALLGSGLAALGLRRPQSRRR